MRGLLTVLWALLIATQLPGLSARAEGAIVVGTPQGGLREGFAYGLSHNFRPQPIAVEKAFEICRMKARENKFSPTSCELIEAFKDKCAAVAMDAKDHWAGWATASSKAAAQQSALAECGKGAQGCKITDTLCDGRAN